MVHLFRKFLQIPRQWLLLLVIFMMAAEPAFAVKKFIRVSQGNDDAEEDVSDGSMSRGSSDLEMPYDGSTEQLVGIRFQDVDVPQGATILSAYIQFTADESDSGSITLNIDGEAIDDAPVFSSSDDDISDRALTTDGVRVSWSPPSWTEGEIYQTPDLTDIAQEIVDRTGWLADNDMVFIISRSSGSSTRVADSYNGDDETAPLLIIEYDALASTPGGSLCYAVEDDGNHFVIVDTDDGTDTDVGDTDVGGIEAIAIDPNGLDVYGADEDQLGWIDPDTGEFFPLAQTFGTGGGSEGNITFDDVDSLAFDSSTGILWGVDARGGDDALFQIDPDTGAHVPDVFGSGVDYVLISGSGIGGRIDDIAIDPSSGTMYGSDTSNSQLITINTSTGAGTVVGDFSSSGGLDMEGMGFHFDGTLYATTDQQLYTVNTSTGAATQVGSGDTLTVGDDYEAFDCNFTALTRAVITRFEAFDDGGRVVVEWETASEDGTAGFYLYRFDSGERQWVLVHENLLPGLYGSPQGGVYHLVDETAPLEGKLIYALLEVEMGGRILTHGPYWVSLSTEALPFATGERFSRKARRTQSKLLRRERLLVQRQLWKARAVAPSVSELKVRVREPGLYFLSVQQIAEVLGSPSYRHWVARRLTSSQISIDQKGEEIAWLGAGNGTGLYFYAPGVDSIYYRDDVYRLRFRQGLQMAQTTLEEPAWADEKSTFVDGARGEEDRFAATVVGPDPESDYWFWDYVMAGEVGKSFELNVPAPSDKNAAAFLTVGLYGATTTGVEGEHHARVRLNGAWVGETSWTGLGPHELTVEVSQGLIHEGGNAVEVAGLLHDVPYSIFYVDTVALRYHHLYRAENDQLLWRGDGNRTVALSGFTDLPIGLYDVTSARQPVQVPAGNRFRMRPMRRRSADRIENASGDFQRLVAPASPDHVYLAVGPEGLKTPEVLPWSRAELPLGSRLNRAEYLVVAPDHLIAAGGRLADYRASQGLLTRVVDIEHVYNEFGYGFPTPHALRDFLAFAKKHWQRAPRYVVLLGTGSLDYRDLLGIGDNLIPPLMAKPTTQGIFASDNAFVSVVGADEIPEMAIGRIPVTTEQELDSYLGKMQAFERTGPQTLLLVSDTRDAGGAFTRDNRSLASPYRSMIPIEEISLDILPFEVARDELLAQFKRGVALLSYAGHGGLGRLTSPGLLTTEDVPFLKNADRAPILISLSCSTNRFELPEFEALGAALVRQSDGGAVAVWAPTGLAAHQESVLLMEVFLAGFYGESERIGDAILGALTDYARYADSERLLRLFTLLGDPALRIPQ